MTISTKTSVRDRGLPRHRARSSIARLLHAHYSLVLDEPMPSEIKNLVAQCLAIEARKDGSTEWAIEVLQIAPPAPPIPIKDVDPAKR